MESQVNLKLIEQCISAWLKNLDQDSEGFTLLREKMVTIAEGLLADAIPIIAEEIKNMKLPENLIRVTGEFGLSDEEVRQRNMENGFLFEITQANMLKAIADLLSGEDT